MPLRLSFGPDATYDLDAEGDLAKHLVPGTESLIKLGSTNLLDTRIAELPPGAISLGFQFSSAPSWKFNHLAGFTLSVQPEAECSVSILGPGETLYQYSMGSAGQPVPERVPNGQYYAAIKMDCSIAVDAGVRYSAGNLGLSGNVTLSDKFRFANYRRLQPQGSLRNSLVSLFSSFCLPFHVESVSALSEGECIDFEFAGKLELGFGATYGFSSALFGGRSGGEVKSSLNTGVGQALISAKPTFQVAAGFKLSYSHEDAFRVIVKRIAGPEGNGATMYLFRKDSSAMSTKESFGLSVSAGAEFRMDGATLKSHIQQVCRKYLNGNAAQLTDKLAGSVDSLVSDVNSSVNRLLKKGDDQKIALEFIQSKTRDDTALFIYSFDFTQNGRDAYPIAMKGDWASAVTYPGVEIDPRSFIEQTYVKSAGINLQCFDLLHFQDVTTYLNKTEITYSGSRTFQLRTTKGIKAVTGSLNNNHEADLFFTAECRNVAGSIAVADLKIALQVVFVDCTNSEAAQQTRAVLAALGLPEAAALVADWAGRNTSGALCLRFGASAAQFSGLQANEYQNGHPPPEPHDYDLANYQAYLAAFELVGQVNNVSQVFRTAFGRYTDWLAFNRIKTDERGSTKPGDRKSTGNLAASLWPDGYPPTDLTQRHAVQVHIYAAQHFMNFCECLKHLASDLTEVQTQQQYEAMLKAIDGMIRKDIPYPTYFLKPGLVALVKLLGGKMRPTTSLPEPNTKDVTVDCEMAIS